ncbi:acyl dehydratase [Sphingomonas leidyi]|uniref:Acyl dehydratase n=1 Tax=Sphingomonas leidyi TaxID=68569 RepID=A0A7X5UXX2_9SPHN|nr:MaoC family dehydratase [Sphingomonas leidyi]NIJ64233.1 acyl dehydratase [Sphingomonas leidyi]
MTSSAVSQALYLDDIAVGDEFVSGRYHIDAEQIMAFASQFDPQPFHTDPEAAKQSFFQGLAASGWHTMSITMRLIVESVPFAGGIVGAGGELSWRRPTRPDDVLYVRSKVVEIIPSRSKPDRGIVMVQSLTLNQRDEVLQDSTAKLVLFRKQVG